MHISEEDAAKYLKECGVPPKDKPSSNAQSIEVKRRLSKESSTTTLLLLQLGDVGCRVNDPAKQYRFDETRKWRFDFAFPSVKLAVELQGLKSHQTFGQFISDCEKFSKATALGWSVMPILHSMVADGTAADLIVKSLEARGYFSVQPE